MVWGVKEEKKNGEGSDRPWKFIQKVNKLHCRRETSDWVEDSRTERKVDVATESR